MSLPTITKKIFFVFLSIIVVFSLLMLLVSCNEEGNLPDDSSQNSESDSGSNDSIRDSESESDSGTSTDSSSENTTDLPVIEPVGPPEFVNPLTGLAAEYDMSGQKPAAILFGNDKNSCPQVGISEADILYECLVEGGITRLMMVVQDYGALDVVGGIRSSRDYFVDYSMGHDAILVMAGGSTNETGAYATIKQYGVPYLDGVNMYLPSTFYRDAARKEQLGYVHSLMTTGAGIEAGIKYKKHSTDHEEGFENTFHFADYDTVVTLKNPKEALFMMIPFSADQFPQFIYNSETETYYRYQFNGEAHIDGANNEQLNFTNLLVIACTHDGVIDSEGRIGVVTTGDGEGYYVTRGEYTRIKWSKASEDAPLVITELDGTPLVMNIGKTYVGIVSNTVKSNITFTYPES